MKNKLVKVIAIVGPTASGKSELAVSLAKKFGGEIISADSRQIYRGLDIGTGKITKKEMRGVPHHLLDIANPKKQFTAADFQKLAAAKLEDIARRGKIPFVVGGTGFWIDTLLQNITLPEVPPNPELRKKLAPKTAAELLKILKKLDQKRAQTIEEKNPRRLVRAIEIAKALGKVPEIKFQKSPYEVLWLGIKVGQENLKTKIRARVVSRMRRGLVEEARRLKKDGLSWKRFYELGLDYGMLADYLRGDVSKKDLAARIFRADWDYARRQLVWFKKNKKIKWVSSRPEAEKLIRKFLAFTGRPRHSS